MRRLEFERWFEGTIERFHRSGPTGTEAYVAPFNFAFLLNSVSIKLMFAAMLAFVSLELARLSWRDRAAPNPE